MNVSCPNCSTTYRVDPAKVPEAGVRARCAVCSAVFSVRRDAAAPAAPAATPVADRQPAADTIAAAPAPVEAAASSATLEGVTVLGDVRQAMFRTPRETITVAEGAQLGERRATRIGAEGVELRGPDGRLQVIGIGGRVPID